MDFSIFEFSLIGAILLHLHSSSMALAIQKLADVAGTIFVVGLAHPIRQIVFPLPLILITIIPIELPMPICLVAFYFSFVITPIRFYNSTFSFATTIYKSSLHIVSIIEV